jgi:hypothetical protein
MAGRHRWLVLAAVPILTACELDEVSLTEPEPVLVAEVYLKVGDGQDELSAFLQWTLGDPDNTELVGASIGVMDESGRELVLGRTVRGDCLAVEILDDVDGICFVARGLEDGSIRPGEHLEVRIALPDGRTLDGASPFRETSTFFGRLWRAFAPFRRVSSWNWRGARRMERGPIPGRR